MTDRQRPVAGSDIAGQLAPLMAQGTSEKPGYVICTSPRSGSTLLCSMLADTGRAGQPWSYIHKPSFMEEWAGAWHLPAQDTMARAAYDAAYLRATLKAGCGSSPVFGMRLQHAYLPVLADMLRYLGPAIPTNADCLERAFGPLRYVHLTREDKVAQAVSLVKARQTGLWHRNADGSERERSGPPAEPTFQMSIIKKAVEELTRADHGWHAWFKQQDIEPLRISYEALSADPVGTVTRLCAALNIVLPATWANSPPTARLADASSIAWADHYRGETGLIK